MVVRLATVGKAVNEAAELSTNDPTVIPDDPCDPEFL